MNVSRLPTITLACLLICTTIYHVAPVQSGSDFWLLVLDIRDPGNLWRMLCAHFAHTDKAHLIWNLGAMTLLGGVLETLSRARLVGALVAGMIGVNLWFPFSSLTLYCGFSGVLNALLVVLLNELYIADRSSRARFNNLIVASVLIGAFGKALIELYLGGSLVTQLTWASAPGAHLAGLLAGVTYVLWLRRPPAKNVFRDEPVAPALRS